MKSFKGAVAEIRSTLNRLIVFDTVINAILVFLVFFVVLAFFDLPLVYPLVVSAAYFFFVLRRRLRISKIRMVEQRYRNLNEKLRTAAEYADADNRVVRELHSEVLSDLRGVEDAAFVNEKRIYLKSIVIVALCFVILLLSPVSFGILDFNFNIVDKAQDVGGDSPFGPESGGSKIRVSVGSEDSGVKKVGGDIYGAPAIAKLGNDEIKVRLKPAGTELSIRDVGDVEELSFSDSYPVEAVAVAAEGYEESIPKEDLELVRNYFNTLSGRR
ncbi:hypothetical protein HYU12_00525 [Candidatus Woesearchaeota archaeon]|nr:hypothetical protein [Candidatus Woesearchaeota archaeon]